MAELAVRKLSLVVQLSEALVHLAAEPNDAPFDVLLGPNVVGLYNVMNAAREAELRRVVLASSIQVVKTRRQRLHSPRLATSLATRRRVCCASWTVPRPK